MFINNPGHITKMATMPIYGKNPSKAGICSKLKVSLMGKNSRKWANGQNIYGSEYKIDPSGSSVPSLGL